MFYEAKGKRFQSHAEATAHAKKVLGNDPGDYVNIYKYISPILPHRGKNIKQVVEMVVRTTDGISVI